jgi:5'(3')-deoxyribonucleotidase
MKTRLEFLCDMDGCVTDFSGPFIDLHNSLSEQKLVINDQTEFNIFKHTHEHIHPLYEKMIRQYGFFLNLKPLPGAIDGLRQLNEIVDIHILTSPPRKNHLGKAEKYMWIEQKLPFIDERNVVLIDHKFKYEGDIILDDNKPQLTRYALRWPKAHLLTINYAYNANLDPIIEKRVTRFDSCADTEKAWHDIVEHVKCLVQ